VTNAHSRVDNRHAGMEHTLTANSHRPVFFWISLLLTPAAGTAVPWALVAVGLRHAALAGVVLVQTALIVKAGVLHPDSRRA
jgi:hypothetical protein